MVFRNESQLVEAITQAGPGDAALAHGRDRLVGLQARVESGLLQVEPGVDAPGAIGIIDEMLNGLFTSMAEGKTFIFDLATAFDFFRDIVVRNINWMTKKVADFVVFLERKFFGSRVGQFIRGQLGFVSTLAGGGGLTEAGQTLARGVAGGGPRVVTGGGGGGMVNAPQVSVETTINAAPGMSVESLSGEFRRVATDVIEDTLRGTNEAFTTAVAPTVP